MRVTRVYVRLGGVASLVLAAASCEYIGGPCTLEARAAIVVEIRHAFTGAPLADSAEVRVTEGSFLELLELCGVTGTLELVRRCGVYERTGTYEILVTRPGFEPWSRSGIPVMRDACHVRTATLGAALMPPPSDTIPEEP